MHAVPIMTKVIPIVMDIGSELLQLVPVVLELGLISLNLRFTRSAGFVCGQLLLVLLDLLRGCLQLLFVLFDVLLIALNVLFERLRTGRCAGRCWCIGLGESRAAENQHRCQNQVKSLVHCVLPLQGWVPHF